MKNRWKGEDKDLEVWRDTKGGKKKMAAIIYFNKCSCGWYFPALSKYVRHCPQCRDIVQRCIDCGEEIEGLSNKRYCKKCAELIKRIYNKYHSRDRRARQNFKSVATSDDICNYDCFNCEFSECLLPVDEDDETGRLFDEHEKKL